MGHIPSTGAKEFLMALRRYQDLIETFEFGAQFSIFSGFRLVLVAMDENETLQQLIGELKSSKIWREALVDVVKALLKGERTEGHMAFDSCIAAYIYCLWKADLETGYIASTEVLKAADLWWSAKLALLVRKEYVNDQIVKSINLRSDHFDQMAYSLEGKRFRYSRSLAMYSQIRDLFPASQDITRLYKGGQDSSDRIRVQNVSLVLSSVCLAEDNVSNPSQEFELTMANG